MNSIFVDLYELTMAASYLVYKKDTLATFDLFIRQMPPERSYFIFAGLEDVLKYIRDLRFRREEIQYLRGLKLFSNEFLRYLKGFRFTGDIWAMPEGTVFFPEEPVIRVTAPIIEAQIVESAILNTVNLQTTMATKASRVMYSAKGRPVYDFSLRRTQGISASLQSARCSYITGSAGSSNVLAGKLYGLPVVGTMAHSFIMSFSNELAGFRAFASTFPKKSVLLIDTYNQMQGLENAIRVAHELEHDGKRLIGIRMDSGDIASDSKKMRRRLDKEGLGYVRILASGNLDEYKIKELLEKSARIDSFGVGTHMGTSSDMPYSDVIYKISAVTDSQGRFLPTMKLSKGKHTFPGRKQVYRRYDSMGGFKEDILALEGEVIKNAKPLLVKVMEKGKITHKFPRLEGIKRYCLENVSKLPERYKRIEKPAIYPVLISHGLDKLTTMVKNRIRIPQVVFMDIDTQHDFINRNGKLSVPGADKIVPNLKGLTEFARTNKILVIASMDRHTKNDPEFRKFPPHCIIDTKGQGKIPETRIKDGPCIILGKNKLSIFTNPNAKTLLKGVSRVYLYGVATEYCVKEAALGLIDMGIKVIIIKDAVKAVDPDAGKKALKGLKKRGVEFITTKELIGSKTDVL